MKLPIWLKRISVKKIKNKKIPIYAPIFIGNERKYLNACLDQEWVSSKGEFVALLEQEIAKYCKVKYAVACSSGTAALFLALKSLGIGPGDEVIVPSFTMIASAFAVSYTGATPVFADCDLDTANLSISSLEPLITKRTKAVMPVHIYGNPCDMDSLQKIADAQKIFLVEDAAEAFGSEYKGKRIGSISNLTGFSFYVNKTITTGEGGMVTTNSKRLYKILKNINNYSFSQRRHFWHSRLGYNLRMSNLEAAVGLGQIEYCEEILDRKRKIAQTYHELLKDFSEYILPLKILPFNKSNYWMIAYRLQNEKDNVEKLREELSRKGIETRSFFIPLHLQPAYKHLKSKIKFSNSEKLSSTGILLPSGPGLRVFEIENICELIKKFFRGH
ncbi:DegT/DnrJ/EryC1/StrS family aminotransferase [Candidatus Microgenomates bacterium]|nr:DegT/DnrJ/EryC1/StrS family aminotransferase [Candidatus Microgenomates bacterium]